MSMCIIIGIQLLQLASELAVTFLQISRPLSRIEVNLLNCRNKKNFNLVNLSLAKKRNFNSNEYFLPVW
mgnify:CR=1 FL=1